MDYRIIIAFCVCARTSNTSKVAGRDLSTTSEKLGGYDFVVPTTPISKEARRHHKLRLCMQGLFFMLALGGSKKKATSRMLFRQVIAGTVCRAPPDKVWQWCSHFDVLHICAEIKQELDLLDTKGITSSCHLLHSRGTFWQSQLSWFDQFGTQAGSQFHLAYFIQENCSGTESFHAFSVW